MHVLRFKKRWYFLVPLAAITGVFISSLMFNSAIAVYTENVRLAKNCAQFDLRTDDVVEGTTFDPEKKILRVEIRRGNKTKMVELPSSFSNSVLGCSVAAKSILKHAQIVYQKRLDNLCLSFREVVNGKRPLRPKGGRVPNINGAISFVKNYCD